MRGSVFADPECPLEDQPLARHRFLIQKAWEWQNTIDETEPHVFTADVDLEAIRELEEGLFDSGGVQGWGTSVNGHMDHWDPYAEFHHLPSAQESPPKRKVFLFT
jgi:hypothetical protein